MTIFIKLYQVRHKIQQILKKAAGETFEVTPQENEKFGHYTTAVAMKLAKERGENPRKVAEEIAAKLVAAAPQNFFLKVEVAGAGFVNMWLTDDAVRAGFKEVSENKGRLASADLFKGKKVMIEYTDPNPFKQFHIGHLMTNTIGESLARIHEAAGAEVMRVNYQGDVGVHVAKSVWGMLKLASEMPGDAAPLGEKTVFLGRAYTLGSKTYEEDSAAKAGIDAINKKIYERSDAEVNSLYDKGRSWSLEYFETLYTRLGTKFEHYFFESEIGPDGVAIVKAHPEVFVESQGAVIFPGEKYGLHNRVFINSLGLPTYEAKELGLNKKKFDLYHPDASIISTANEINEYFKVLLKAMELTVPEVALKTRHVGHGMLRLPTGKMSSRTGDVITAEGLLEDIKEIVAEKIKDREFNAAEKELIKEKVALAAVRYSILRQGVGKDIIFDAKTSVAFHGESGPYLQYTYARLNRVVKRSVEENKRGDTEVSELTTEHEMRLMRKLFGLPDEITRSVENLTANNLATYLFEFANLANRFYEDQLILADENAARRGARLLLSEVAARVLREGLHLLGIEVLESI